MAALMPLVNDPDAEAIDEVIVHASLYTVLTGHGCVEYIRGPGTPVGALVLWIPYLVATALLTGDLSPADLTPDGMRDPRRWALAERVRVVHDPDVTRAS